MPVFGMYNNMPLEKTINFQKNGFDNPAFEQSIEDDLAKTPQISTANNTNLGQVVKERVQWDNGLEFLMSCIAMSVGLGNIWRFPFTAYENGGGAFLIPYIIVLTIIGRPIYYMEMVIGQFCGKGNVKLYKSLAPGLKGVAYGQVIGALCVASYYCSLMSITLFYLFNSFTVDLPWTSCRNEWNAYLERINKSCAAASVTDNTRTGALYISSSELYFTQEVLKQSDDISDGIGAPEWRLTLFLLLCWIVTFLISVKGVKSSGKASYFLALFPYVIMIALLIRAATLPGAEDGMYYFIKTDWSKLLEPDVWYAAVTQCFFSLNVGFGSIIMYSSHNNFHHNINRDVMIVTILDTFTSLLSGVTIFGILGNLAYNLGVTPDDVINSGGTGLAFISYPDAIANFDAVPWLFAILFFFMLFVLGVGSLVALHGTVNTVVQDIFPDLSNWKVSLLTTIVAFLIGLMYVTPGGQYMLNLVDYFGGTFIIFVFVIIENIGIAWLYGIEEFCMDVEFMLKIKVGIYWRITWFLITPILLITIFIYFIIKIKPLTYGQDNSLYPNGISAFGWCILGVSVAQFLFWIIYYMCTYQEDEYSKRILKIFSCKNWGPSDKNHYDEWKKFKEDSRNHTQSIRKNRMQRKIDFLLGR